MEIKKLNFEDFLLQVRSLLNQAVDNLNIPEKSLYGNYVCPMLNYSDGGFVHCSVILKPGNFCLFGSELDLFKSVFDCYDHGDIMLYSLSNGNVELTINVFNK